MPPPIRSRQPTGHAALEWILTDDGSRTLWDARLDETFHSGCGAVAETLIVYLFHSGVLQRLRNLLPSVVVEYGLGTATGFLLTAAVAECYRTQLTYYALERELLPWTLFRDLQLPAAAKQCVLNGFAKPACGTDPELRADEFQHLPHLVDAFCDFARQSQSSSTLLTSGIQLTEFVHLRVLLGDICHPETPHLHAIEQGSCDAIYYDPFSPETNPDLWTAAVFQSALAFLKPDGRLCSYCVKSSVRQELTRCGFLVHKAPGPVGGKREVLLAHKRTSASPG